MDCLTSVSPNNSMCFNRNLTSRFVVLGMMASFPMKSRFKMCVSTRFFRRFANARCGELCGTWLCVQSVCVIFVSLQFKSCIKDSLRLQTLLFLRCKASCYRTMLLERYSVLHFQGQRFHPHDNWWVAWSCDDCFFRCFAIAALATAGPPVTTKTRTLPLWCVKICIGRFQRVGVSIMVS